MLVTVPFGAMIFANAGKPLSLSSSVSVCPAIPENVI